MRANTFTFIDLRRFLLLRTDKHAGNTMRFILSGSKFGVADRSWTAESRNGRFYWDPERTEYSSAPTFTTGGMASEFDRRISQMVEQEKFELLTSSVNTVTREQYVKCWRRWARFRACMDVIPWLNTSQVGWGNVLIDFLAWGRKLLGIQHITLAKRFFAIRFIHIAEGHGDLSLRAFRVKTITKAIKLRGGTCKKVPLITDLSRWLRRKLQVGHPDVTGRALQLWAGLLVAFFFCLRIPELLALSLRDIASIEEDAGRVLSILIRPSKTDQGKSWRNSHPSREPFGPLPGDCVAQFHYIEGIKWQPDTAPV